MTIKRQDLVDAVDTRLKTILTTAGYRTNIGANVFQWREFAAISPSELPCIVFADRSETPELVNAGRNSTQKRTLTIEYEIIYTGTESKTIMTNLRKGQADIEDAIRTDVKFGNLALWTKPAGTQLGLTDQNTEDMTGILTGSFEIVYQTGFWNSEA